MSRTVFALALTSLLVVGCDDATAPRVATQIAVTPGDTAIAKGTTAQLSATVRDSSGNVLSNAPVEWTSDNNSIATVSATGLVHSVGPSGTVTIRATTDSLSASTTAIALVTVLDSLLIGRTKLSGSPYAAAISSTNVAYVGQTTLSRVARASLPSHVFSDTVAVGLTPTEIAFNSTGTRAYVTNQYSGSIVDPYSTVSVVDVATDTQIDTIRVGYRPFELIVAPGDSILYVATISEVFGIRLATKDTVARFGISEVGNGLAIARDTLLYISTHNGGTVVEFNLRTRALGRTFAVGGVPQKLAVSPNGSELYIANESGYVQFWNLDTGLQVGTNLVLPSAAYGMARRSSNGLLYVTAAYFGGGYIYVINPVTRTLVYSTIVGGSTRHVVFTADGSTGIVPNEGGWVDFLR